MSGPGLDEHNIWRDLDPADRDAIRARMKLRQVGRGETLVLEGKESQSFFVVHFGLFEVLGHDGERIVAEIGANELIGEIGFFSRTRRTATVIAARDSQVLENRQGRICHTCR